MAVYTVRSTRHTLTVTLAELELEFSLDDGGLRALRRPDGQDVIGRGTPHAGIDVSLADTGWLTERSFARYLNHILFNIPDGVEIVVVIGLGPLKIYDRYRVIGSLIARRISLENTGEDELALCGVRLAISGACVGAPERCRFEAPANVVRPRMPIATLRSDVRQGHWSDATTLETPAFALAPADAHGVLALHNDMLGETLACWYADTSHPARPRVEGDGNSVTLLHEIRLAERLRVEVALSVGVQMLLLERAPWHEALPRIRRMMPQRRIDVSPPSWLADTAIFVTHPMHYGNVAGLIDALDAIRRLGCATMCLLPVHDIAAPHRHALEWSPMRPEDLYALRSFTTLDASIGGIEGLRRVVAAAHARHMRVVIDLPLSGCAADSPYVHHHPEWFCLDQTGQFIRFSGEVDTLYFDWRNADLRSLAISEALALMEQTGIDGFRVLVARDVPPGWPLGSAFSGSSSMGVTRLIEELYAAIRQHYPDAALMTDLAGPLLASSRDLLIDQAAHHMFTQLAIGRLSVPEMQHWLADALAIGDPGTLRACFTESHHSCVSNPLAEVLRGSRAARMILAGMVGCGYVPMIRAGQEHDQADREFIAQLLNARARSIALRRGTVEPDGARCNDPAIFVMLRRHEEECVVTLLNASPMRRWVTLELPRSDVPEGDYLVSDLLDEPLINGAPDVLLQHGDLTAFPVALGPFAARFLALRSAPAPVLHTSGGHIQESGNPSPHPPDG
ncbi:alpha-amylase family glycosyl hydrolase [Roseiflexus sp.]|uniref:alpha-amylase family glycosyl hydrolase n=1 Tax=Roseiflexus sp. TaxID=2562120 RepID=UPI0021DDE3EA|nr:alpha-amylase family glycosyl hydrolase [Roseiflexus sp.]GIV99339.1 MAG: alpha-amylase [Roseiflexus sp.]